MLADRISAVLERILETLTLVLLIALAAIVIIAVVMRYSGNSPIWYDELASVLLAWITFSGASYAALKGAHLGFSNLLAAVPMGLRFALFLAGEAVVITTFTLVAWAGWTILGIFGDEALVSLPWVPRAVTQAIVPVSAVLFIVARLLRAPKEWRRLAAGRTAEDEEIETEIARAQASLTEASR
jgi:TRAP-type C4-dicarboxylate transport system permease small subunit